MRLPNGSSATNILLLVIYCLWCHIQPTAGGKCSGQWAIHACAGGNGKRSDIDDLVQAVDLGSDVERPDIQEARGGERRGDGGRESDGFRGAREGDDLRSEFSDLRQLSEERQLPNNGNSRHLPRSAPLESALGRLRSLLRKTALDVDDGEGKDEKEEQWQDEEPLRRSGTDTDRRYIVKDSLTMMRRILDDIERRVDAQPIRHSVSKTHGDAAAEDNYYSLQKRAADQ